MAKLIRKVNADLSDFTGPNDPICAYKSLIIVYLDMVWSQDDPATEAVAKIDDGHAAAEPNHIRERCSKCHDQDLWEAQ